MKIVLFLSLFLFSNTLGASQLDPLSIYQYPQCKGRKSQLTQNQLQFFKSIDQFLRPHDPLNRFSKNLENLNQKGKLKSCDPTIDQSISLRKHLPIHAQKTFDQFQNNLVQEISRDIQKQNEFMSLGKECALAAQKIRPMQSQMVNLSQLQYQQVLSIEKAFQCAELSKNELSDLKNRIDDLRISMSVAFSEDKTGQPSSSVLKHPKAYSTDLIQIFFPTVWKKDSKSFLSSLSLKEKERSNAYLQELQAVIAAEDLKVTPREIAEDTYFQLIAEAPMMLFLDQHMNPRDLERAFSKMIEQNSIDLEEFKRNPNQDLVLRTPYVLSAIDRLPESEKGDACLMISEVFQNLKKRYEDYPTYIARMGVVSTIIAGIHGQTIKLAGARLLKGLGVTFSANQATISSSQLRRYYRNVQICNATAMESTADAKLMCQFRESDQAMRGVQKGAVRSLGAMVVLGALGRLISK